MKMRWLVRFLRWILAKLEIRASDPYRIRVFDGSLISWVLAIFIMVGLFFLFLSFQALFSKKVFYQLSPDQIRSAVNFPTLPFRNAPVKPWPTERDFRKKVGVLNIGMPNVPNTLDPLEIVYYPFHFAIHGVYRPLIELDESDNIHPGIAQAWFFKNGNRTIHFELDPKAHFHDGTPITAEDVAYTFSRFCWPGMAGTDNNFLRDSILGSDDVKHGEIVSGIKVLDPYHIEFHIKSPRPTLLKEMSGPGWGILPKGRFEGKDPLSSGPVQAYYNQQDSSWSFFRTTATKDTATKEKDTEDDSTTFGRLQYLRIIPTSLDIHKTRQKILDGTLDLVFAYSSDWIRDMEFPKEYVLAPFPVNSIAHFFYNMERPLFQDQEFRQDLSYAIQTIADDYKDINQIFTRLKTYIPIYLLPTTYYERKTPFFSVESLEEKWEGKLPKKLEIATIKNGLDKDFIKKLNQHFDRIGISLEWTEYNDYDTYYKKALEPRNYDILLGRYSTSISEVEPFLSPLNNKDKMAYSNADSTKLFDKIDAFRELTKWTDRVFAYQEALEEFEAKHYMVPLFQYQIPVIKHTDLFLGEFKPYNYNHENVSYWKMRWKKPEGEKPKEK